MRDYFVKCIVMCVTLCIAALQVRLCTFLTFFSQFTTLKENYTIMTLHVLF